MATDTIWNRQPSHANCMFCDLLEINAKLRMAIRYPLTLKNDGRELHNIIQIHNNTLWD